MKSNTKRWSEWEDKRMIDLKVGQRLSLRDISSLLNRSEGAVSRRLSYLKKNGKTPE
jgi:DNA-binding Lrp family transcriptional regulator